MGILRIVEESMEEGKSGLWGLEQALGISGGWEKRLDVAFGALDMWDRWKGGTRGRKFKTWR